MSASPEVVRAAAARVPRRAQIADIVRSGLTPLVRKIDEGQYPEEVLRRLGSAGAFLDAGGDLQGAIAAMASVAEHCLATAFCMWCQDTLAWYLLNTENEALRKALLPAVGSGLALGGTGLSNPMKALAGIEPMRVRGRPVKGGFVIDGSLPWVSNLGANHSFGTAFEIEGARRQVMAVIDCSAPGVRLGEGARFLALDGTRTCSVGFRGVFVPSAQVLADPAGPFIARIKAGFILLQTGMGLGVVRGCVEVMRKSDERCGEVNRFLPDRPELFLEALEQLTAEISLLAKTPLDTACEYQRKVLQVRLAASEWSLRAAQAALLHAGAKGYLAGAAAQRKLREAYFVAIVTPAIKHLRKELAAMP